MAHNCLEESSRHAEIEDPSIPLVTSMESKLKGLHPLSSEYCIYRVPKKLHQINEAAYTPLRVSIGPFHHGRKGLEAMEDHKWRYLQNFLQSTKKGMAEFVKLIKNNEGKVRQCYAETIDFHSDKFVEIILVDAVFIIGVLLRHSLPYLADENDRIFGKSWRMISDIKRDLMLLENQLPFFILEDLFEEVTLQSQYESLSMIKLTHNFYKDSVELEENLRSTNSTEVKHFIDFLRSCLNPSKPRTEPQRGKIVKDIHLRCATELIEAGVKFMVCSNKNFFDIKFENGILKIPHFVVTDETESLLRNILAFEQCHYEAGYISDYVAFMDSLINTRKDVELLVGKKVIGHWLGDSEDVSTLFNKLGKEIMLDSNEFYFSRLQEDLDDYCNSNWHKWKANLKRDHLRTPWKEDIKREAVEFFQELFSSTRSYTQGQGEVKGNFEGSLEFQKISKA
ncbi:hypothetical protein F0562_007272 [Nyssa sinensis]|uniref:Uncharacterized protein n=1 Tax=Nyssa sinensis TaxID=561372 RepID=A0A5J5A4L6_9ASTE|nr:hypothetical protein F0562_007272 [Nyssa sinensis]